MFLADFHFSEDEIPDNRLEEATSGMIASNPNFIPEAQPLPMDAVVKVEVPDIEEDQMLDFSAAFQPVYQVGVTLKKLVSFKNCTIWIIARS